MEARQRKDAIIDFITTYIDEHGYSPTYREIACGVGLRSAGTVAHYIKTLEKEGRLTVGDNMKPRTVGASRRVDLEACTEDTPQRIALEVADGGVIYFDCSVKNDARKGVSLSFSGVLDATRLKGSVSRVVRCTLDAEEA